MSEITENIFHYTEANRRAWNEIAQVRHAKQPPASFFAQGNSTLDARELQATGEVKGRRLLHLQCATGEDTLSWSVAGAEVTGVDISEEQIKLARQKAAAAGLSTRFLAADLYGLPPDLQAGNARVCLHRWGSPGLAARSDQVGTGGRSRLATRRSLPVVRGTSHCVLSLARQWPTPGG